MSRIAPRNRRLTWNAADFGTARTQVEINAAISAAKAAGGGRVLVNRADGPWTLSRFTSGSQGGSIRVDAPNITLVSDGAVLNLAANCSFIGINSTLGAQVTITADTAITDTTLTVASTVTLTTGQWVFLRLGQAAYDAAEPDFWLFAKVASLPDGTHVTLDRPVGYALTVASVVSASQKSIAPITTMIENVGIEGTWILNNPLTGNANSESGLSISGARNIRVGAVTGTDPGAGVVLAQFVEGLDIDRIICPSSIAQNGHTAKGRVLNLGECRAVTVRQIDAENFEGAPIHLEARCEGIRIGAVNLKNSHPTRSLTATSLIYASGNSRVSVDSLHATGRGSLVQDSGGTTGNDISLREAWFYTSTRPLGGLPICRERVYVDGTLFTQRKTWRKRLSLASNLTGAVVTLPAGHFVRVAVYTSSTTGITNLTLGATGTASNNVVSELVAGSTVELSQGRGFGAGYNASANTGKRIIVSTDGTVPSGAFLVVEAQYFADPAAVSMDEDLPALLPGSGPVASTYYNPGTDPSWSTTSTTHADVDATNAAVTFTTPDSGAVWVQVEAFMTVAPNTSMDLSLREGASVLTGTTLRVMYSTGTLQLRTGTRWKIIGLTPGSSHTLKLGFSRSGGTGAAEIHAGPGVGPLSLRVEAA